MGIMKGDRPSDGGESNCNLKVKTEETEEESARQPQWQQRGEPMHNGFVVCGNRA